MARPLIVVCNGSVVGAECVFAGGNLDHLIERALVRQHFGHGPALRRVVGLAQFELQGLEYRLVVLILVLKNHVVHVAAGKQRVALIEIRSAEPLQNVLSNLRQALPHEVDCRKRKSCSRRARMLEGVVHPRHFRELDGAVEILCQPELLEVCDVSQVPQNRAHQRIVLAMKLLIGKTFDKKERALPRLGHEAGDQGSRIVGGERHCAHGDG